MDGQVNRTPRVGVRLSLQGHHGTVRYIGEVRGTRGTWLGIEWDDPTRGKHSGEKDGRRYFKCLVSGSGSFIRPSAEIIYGQTFLQALNSKYVETAPTSGGKEMVILGSSKGAIEVEAVGLDKVRAKFAKLERLREISLDTEDVAYADPPGAIRSVCSNIHGLDLSDSLLPTWEMVALIASELPKLETLSLNRNRFAPLIDTEQISSAFLSLSELRLNQVLISWPETRSLLSVMPNLCSLEVGYNNMRNLGENKMQGAIVGPKIFDTKLESLNFDGNALEEWSDIMMAITPFPMLTRLVLMSNRLAKISALGHERPIHHVKHLGIQDNHLTHWDDVDALAMWLPALQTLNISNNPLATGSADFRQLAIARLPSLTVLNGTTVTPKERVDSEIFYLSQIAQNSYSSEAEISERHPRWTELCGKHGAPEGVRGRQIRDTLASRLITVLVYRCNVPPVSGQAVGAILNLDGSPPPLKLRVLPTMAMKVFRLRLLKFLKLPPNQVDEKYGIQVWAVMDGDLLSELDFSQETQDISWWGIEDNSRIIVYTNEAE